jgi:hypothetical protein
MSSILLARPSSRSRHPGWLVILGCLVDLGCQVRHGCKHLVRRLCNTGCVCKLCCLPLAPPASSSLRVFRGFFPRGPHPDLVDSSPFPFHHDGDGSAEGPGHFHMREADLAAMQVPGELRNLRRDQEDLPGTWTTVPSSTMVSLLLKRVNDTSGRTQTFVNLIFSCPALIPILNFS